MVTRTHLVACISPRSREVLLGGCGSHQRTAENMAGTEETVVVEERPKRTKERELEGMRTMEDERANVANRREKTMNGRNEQENPDERTMT